MDAHSPAFPPLRAVPAAPTTGTGRTTEQVAPEPLWREVAGAALKARRIGQGRTLQQVADRAGISPQYLSEVERGRKEPSSEMLASLCGALGLSLAQLLMAAAPRLVPVGVHRSATHRSHPARPAPMSGPVLLAA